MKIPRSTLTLRLLAITSIATLSGVAHAQPRYDFILVNSFNANPLAGEAFIWGVSDNGVACGMATMDNRIGYPGFVWTEATGKAEVPVSSPKAVSINGLVVGNQSVYNLNTSQWTTPPNLPGTYYGPSFAAVNDADVAVGSISTCTCSDSGGIQKVPYIWDAVNGARTLDVPNAKYLYRVNNAGIVLGWMNDLVSQGPFFADMATGAYTAFADVIPPDLGVGYPSAADINDNGEIVGSIPGSYPIYRYGFVYSPSTGVHVLPFPGAGYQQYVSPTSINNAGTVVGVISTTLASQRVFVYTEADGLRDLLTPGLVAGMPDGYRFYMATRINNHGWIVGYGHTAAGKVTGFVLKARVASCPADFDGDATVDFFDYDAFVRCFEGGACPPGKTADFDSDGTVDFFDYDAFVVAFETPC
ncbi:MAG: hypothetical protein AABZ53_16460 [Planctomycetota bacterium]